jgi:hypothetical protein
MRYSRSSRNSLLSVWNGWLSVRFWRIVWFLFVALMVWLILTQPTTAANIVNGIVAILRTAATNITSFFTQLL